MKKLGVLLFFCLVSPFLLRSNPIALPYFSEIYFEGNDWFIELVYWDGLGGEPNFDNLGILCSSGSSRFKPGIEITYPHWIIITRDSMLSPLTLNKYGDFLQLQIYDNGTWSNINFPTYFGDFEGSAVNYPFEGQSIVNTTISAVQMTEFWSVKENIPTLGSSFYEVTTFGIYSGRVLDQNFDPIESIKVKYCPDDYLGQSLLPIYTNMDGYFYSPPHFHARNYAISLIWNGISLLDTSVTIEPDSTTYCEYYLDTLLTDVPGTIVTNGIVFENFPNPFSINTTFVIKTQENKQYREGRIIVYDMQGKEWYNGAIGQEISGTGPIFHRWDPEYYPNLLPPGEYISCLILDGTVAGKTKSICVR